MTTTTALPEGWSVHTHQDNRGAGRWSYSLTIPGEWGYSSPYRYGSEQTARAAGEADAIASAALEHQEPT